MPQLLRHQEKFTWALIIAILILAGFVIYQSLNESLNESPSTQIVLSIGEVGIINPR